MGEPVAASGILHSGTDALRVRWFYISVALMMIAFNALAFAPPLVDPALRREPLPLTPLVIATIGEARRGFPSLERSCFR
jgi:hypothetical protein